MTNDHRAPRIVKLSADALRRTRGGVNVQTALRAGDAGSKDASKMVTVHN
jgi:hypothetical protein